MVALILLACSEPQSFEDCSTVADAVDRSDCQYRFASEAGDPKPLLDGMTSDLERDVLIVRLAEADPARAGALCNEVRTDSGRRRCESVLGRPHLGTWGMEKPKHGKTP